MNVIYFAGFNLNRLNLMHPLFRLFNGCKTYLSCNISCNTNLIEINLILNTIFGFPMDV